MKGLPVEDDIPDGGGIRRFGNPRTRHFRIVRDYTCVGLAVLLTIVGYYMSQASEAEINVRIEQDLRRHEGHVQYTSKPPAARSQQQKPAADRDVKEEEEEDKRDGPDLAARGNDDNKDDFSCHSTTIADIIQATRTVEMEPLGQYRDHIAAILRGLEKDRGCLLSLRKKFGKVPGEEMVRDTKVFYDLGSRRADQTGQFLTRFPNANKFQIYCFEANPKYNYVYGDDLRKKYGGAHITYNNFAISTTNGTVKLKLAGVGSSIVAEKKPQAEKFAYQEVPTINFAEFLATHTPKGSYVVIKMDIETVEFAVLSMLVKTRAIALVDDILLECHFNVRGKLAPEDRTPERVDKSDCDQVILAMGKVGLTSVDWGWKNDPNTRKYSEGHNRFRPT